MSKGKFYITTPIYYPSDKLHIGHTYCTVATDSIARYKRMCGYDVMFLTGTDEHGQKIEEKAKEAGVTPKQFVDNIVEGPGGVKDLWKLMNISNDRFIRTTDDYHVEAIQRIFKKMYDNGDIYKGAYKGMYCTPCESFWTESQLVNGCCPDCGRPVHYEEEEAYFFRLSKYAKPVQDLLETGTFLEPASRVNEMINNFIKPGLDDLCVSRTSFKWGIPVDFDPGHVVYVWVDALFNYITAWATATRSTTITTNTGPRIAHGGQGDSAVPLHHLARHADELGEPLPKHVYGHGWLLMDGGKMSKSKGNVVDPYMLAERYGTDALRFFLLRTFPFGTDGNFSNELLISTINSTLPTTWAICSPAPPPWWKNISAARLPRSDSPTPRTTSSFPWRGSPGHRTSTRWTSSAPRTPLSIVMKLLSRANKYIDETAPWVLAKDEANRARLATVMYNLLECLRIC
jgi:methionyl-tRNA synthetase